MSRVLRLFPSREDLAIAELSQLAQLHHVAAAAIEGAADRAEVDQLRLEFRRVSGAMTDVAQRVGRIVSDLGGSPPSAASSRPSVVPYTPRAMSILDDPLELEAAVHADLIHLQLARSSVEWSANLLPATRQRIHELVYEVDYCAPFGDGQVDPVDDAPTQPIAKVVGRSNQRRPVARDLMVVNVPIVELSTRLDDVARTLRATGSTRAVVTNGNHHAVGVVTRSDIAIRATADRLLSELTQAADIMSRELVCCDPLADLSTIVALMKSHCVSSILVTTGRRHRLHGVVGVREVAGVASADRVADLVRALAGPKSGTRGEYAAAR